MGQANLADIVENQSASTPAPSPASGTASGTAKLSDIVDSPGQSAAPAPPGLGSKIVEGAKESGIGQIAAPPANHLEAGIMTAGGPAALFAWRTAKGVYDSAAKLVSAEGPDQYQLAKEDFGKAVDEFHAGRKGTAALSAASGVTDVMGAMTPAAQPITSRMRELTEGAKPGGNLATPVTKDIIDAATGYATGKIGGGEAAAGEGDAAASTSRVFNPFRARANKLLGLNIQPTLKNGIQDVWNKVAAAENVPKPLPNMSVREMGEQVGDSVYARSKAGYAEIDEATGNRFSGNEKSLRAVNKEMQFVTNDTEEQNLMIRKQRLEMQADEMFDEALKKGVSKDTVAKAKADFKKAQSIYDTNAQIQNSTTGVRPGMKGAADAPEEVNAKSLMARANKLFNTGRLQTAVGDANAEDLIGHAAKAQKMARNLTRTKVAAGGVAATVLGGREALKYLP